MQSAIGFGQALLLAPALLALADPADALLCSVLVGVVLNVLVVAGERRRPAVQRAQVARLALAGLPAMALGLVVLAVVERPALQVAAGVVVLGALLGRRAPAGAPPRSPAADLGAGAIAGLLTTTTSLNGPPLVLRLRGRPPAEVRDTTSAVLLALNVTGAALLAARGGAGGGALLALALAPAVLLGHRAGRAAFARLDPRRYEAAATALIAVAGVASIAGGLA